MKTYELNYLISNGLGAEKAQDIALKVESLLQEQNGTLTNGRKSKEIELGREINGSKKAVMFSAQFRIEPDNIIVIQQQLKKMPDIIRFMVTIKNPIKVSSKPQRRFQKKAEETNTTSQGGISRKKPKVELKQIEEQLEEILEE